MVSVIEMFIVAACAASAAAAISRFHERYKSDQRTIGSLVAQLAETKAELKAEKNRADCAVSAVSVRAGGPVISNVWDPEELKRTHPGDDMGEFYIDEVDTEAEDDAE